MFVRSRVRAARSTILAALCLCALAPGAQAAPPVVTVDAPEGRTNDSTPDLGGTCEPRAGDVLVGVARNAGTPDEELYVEEVRSCTDGRWLISGYDGPGAATSLEDSSYTVQAQQSADGETGSARRTFVVDTQGPAYLEIDIPGSATNDSTPLYQGRASAGEGDNPFVSIRLLQDGVEIRPSTDHFISPMNENSYIKAEEEPLADGTYTLEVVQGDEAGNTTTATRVFAVDTVAPAPTLDAIATPTRDATPSVSGTGGSARGDGELAVRIFEGSDDAGTPLLTFDAARDEDGAFAADVPEALADGTYTVRVDQSDDAGNAGSSVTRTLVVDTIPPDVTITSPAEGSSSTDPTPTVAGTAFAGPRDLASVQIRIFGAGSEQVGTTQEAPVTGGRYSVDVPELAPGTYTLVVIQRDAAGNSDTEQRTFTVAAAPSPPAAPAAEASTPVAVQTRVVVAPTLAALRAGRICPIAGRSERVTFEATTRGATSISYVVKRAAVRTPRRCASSSAITRTFRATTVFREVGRGVVPVGARSTTRAGATDAGGARVTRFDLKRSIVDGLRPGTYRLSVVARNADGASRTLTYAFRVLAARRAARPAFTG